MKYTIFYYPRPGCHPWCLHYTIGQDVSEKMFATKEAAEEFVKSMEPA